jgi:hypothetical protein
VTESLGAGEPPEIEGKYTVSFGSQHIVLSVLRQICTPDPEHAHGRVNSMYYDTDRLDSLGEKINSDYLKTKYRVRWYDNGSETDQGDVVRGFFEVKRKIGTTRSKSRIPVELSPTDVVEGHESYETFAKLARLVVEMGSPPERPIFPMIVIRYLRDRFVDAASGARIAFDREIAYSSVNKVFHSDPGPRRLDVAVLEVKSSDGRLPPSLRALISRLNARDSFSKYEECWKLSSSHLYRRQLRSMGE